MPDRPKRRKNKNKRKNKNRPDVNKSSEQLNESVDDLRSPEGSEGGNDLEQTIPDNECPVTGTSGQSTEKQNVSASIQLDDPNTNQDLNNNSDIVSNASLTSSITEDVDNADCNNSESYVVESPEQSSKNIPKLGNNGKSKSLDNDDAPKIVELSDDNSTLCDDDASLAIIDSCGLVSDVESDVEWENTDDFEEKEVPKLKEHATGTLSIATIPLNVAQCDHTKSLTPEAEKSLRLYLQTLDLATQPDINSLEIKTEIEQIINREIRHRLRKKGLAEDFLTPRLGPSRVLDVIDEEGSSESSLTSRRHSHISEKKNDNDDLEDDVFESKNPKVKEKFVTKSVHTLSRQNLGRLIPQECLLVGAKIKEPDVSEVRSDWSVKTVEQMKGAEVVYLTDSSSSTSSIHEFGDDTDEGGETDVSVRMITPTIEVTDTESLLKKTFTPSVKIADEEVVSRFKPGSTDTVKVIPITIDNKAENDNSSDQNIHEIVVLSTDNIKTNLYVKDIESDQHNVDETTLESCSNNLNAPIKSDKDYDTEITVLRSELNDAMNNLIKEVSSDAETTNNNAKDSFIRQDSSSSVGSSQCTAKYNPNYSSLNDVSNILHDDTCEIHNKTDTEIIQNNDFSSHVKDIFECVTGTTAQSKRPVDAKHPGPLRDLCVKKIATFPYGDKFLEELASVSQRLQNITILGKKELLNDSKFEEQKSTKMPYFPLPDVSSIATVSLDTKHKDSVPPPITPRHSSLKKSQDDHWTGIPTKTEPVYVCLSPSQKMLMEKTNTVITKEDASELVDMHKKYVDRRGYNEYYSNTKRKENEYDKESPVIPFKSQTGSRLLALIRDPKVTDNINSSMSKQQYYKSVDRLENISSNKDFTKKLNDQLNSIGEFSSNFKPIPPPRPRKYSSSYYESDESDFTDTSFRSMKSERKMFHYSTGTLNKEIESDISSIQNMHRFSTNFRDILNPEKSPRRPSLPKDLCEQQMEYIRQKEKEVEAEIRRLEEKKNKVASPERKGPRAPLISDKEFVEETIQDKDNYMITRKRNISFNNPSADNESKSKMTSLFSSSQEEIQREKMYSEYMNQMAARQERKQQKVIKITNYPGQTSLKTTSKSMPVLDDLDSKVNNRIEKEFICKARERWNKLGIKDPETEDERESGKHVYKEPKVVEHKIKVIEAGQEKDVKKLPSHLQDFVHFTAKEKEQGAGGSAVWRPGAPTPPPSSPAPPAHAPAPPSYAPAPPSNAPAPPSYAPAPSPGAPPPPPLPVWQPSSAGASPQPARRSFRPVHFEDTPPARRKFASGDQNGCGSGSESEQGRLRTSLSAPAAGLSSLGGAGRLPRAQNPTVTLLQKAREGQIPRGACYLQQEREGVRLPRDRPSPPHGDPVYALRKEYASEGEEGRGARKMADANRKVDGIGPITKDGMPVTLRSEVKDPSKWYKKMYDTIHKNKYDDDYVTIRYKSRRLLGQPTQRVTNKSQYAYFDPRSGYLSEPEGGLSRLGSSTWSDAYDSDVTTGPRRRTASVQEERRTVDQTSPYLPSNKYSTLASARASQEVYKNQPGRIENYIPGKSSVVEKEAKQWWDEVMDIFDGQNISSTTSLPQQSPKEKKDLTSAILSKSNMARALKESGYESDSTLVFRRREDAEGPLSPAERRAAYRGLQAGGEPPLRGFRSPAPARQESPRRYVESDVNIHYRCPVRHDPLPLVPERELARQQAEHMKRLYREQRRNKYLQENEISPEDIEAFDASMKELQDMQNRRHQDNFTPSQKSILPLNRYDETDRVSARALYAFNGQTSRELSFRKGDVISVRRQIDANWYEGEVHGRVGLFPYNYVEILKGDPAQSPRKPSTVEGRARAKFDFTAQTNLELPLKKGELVVLTRRIDHNWWEGRNGNKTGIFPDSYVTVLQEPSQNKPELPAAPSADKPLASPAAHGLVNGSARGSMGAHRYTPQPNSPALANAPPATQPLPGYVARPAQVSLTPAERGYGPPPGRDLNNSEPLYVDTNAEAIPYRAMYKYRPQNPDELELSEGDTVYVLEQCDDGWYVGSSQRTGRFGTFPGNYVERI